MKISSKFISFLIVKSFLKLSSLFFIKSAICFPLFFTSSFIFSQGVGTLYPSEMKEIHDPLTGIKLTVLTAGQSNDAKLYHTHPSWTYDGKYIVFRSQRTEGMGYQAFAINLTSGKIIQLTNDEDINSGSFNVARKSGRFYYTKAKADQPEQLYELNTEKLFYDIESGEINTEEHYLRYITTIPDGTKESGGFGLDASEKAAYIGILYSNGTSGLLNIDLQTGKTEKIIDIPFHSGHIQTNPWVPGEILFCHETGGDAPQRMWTVNSDGTGFRPVYEESPDEWVTHEIYMSPDIVFFILSGHLERLRKKPHGICSVNLRTDEAQVIGQVKDQGFWHCNGSPDGKWAVGDTFDGSIYLIDLATRKIKLVSAGHLMSPDHAHPSFSPDSKKILIQSGMLTGGVKLQLMLIDVPGEI